MQYPEVRDLVDPAILTERLPHRVAEILRLYQRASDASAAGIVISDCRQPDMPLIYANPAFYRLTGYAPSEVLGRNCRFLQGAERNQPGLELLRAALRDGRDCSVMIRNYRKGGSLFWNELIMAPMRDHRGELTHFIGIQTDATARVEAEQALKQSNDELERRVSERTAELTIANQTLLAAQYETLDRLARAAEWRDDDTGQHTQRVGRLAGLLATGLGWDAAAIHQIEHAAVLHDVGKIGIPDEILLKAGKLSTTEFDRMQTHTTAGAAILAGSHHPLLQMAETIARTHHERWDGTGYPAGLAGVMIPVSGRIVAVADVFDALTRTRPYKAAWPLAVAVAEIAAQAGRQFDPDVVRVFLALHAAGQLAAD